MKAIISQEMPIFNKARDPLWLKKPRTVCDLIFGVFLTPDKKVFLKN